MQRATSGALAQLAAVAKRWPCARATSALCVERQLPLSIAARAKSPEAMGDARSAQVLTAPALSPKRSTRAGSPRKAAALRCTHWSAAIWSSIARLTAPPGSPSSAGWTSQPRGPMRYWMVTTTTSPREARREAS